MNPVAIFRFSRTEGPGYFATFLEHRGIRGKLIKLDEGDRVPAGPEAYSGFVFMGGPMSANDNLAWIEPILDLIRAAVDGDRPCLGHCLGGQLMSKALGGCVTKNPVKEIGWNEIKRDNSPEARDWLGEIDAFTTFQWHGETFTIPPGAQRILTNRHCRNQAFVLGKHLGMQFHIEMTPEMIAAWCDDGVAEIAAEEAQHRAIAVQQPVQILSEAPARLPRLNAVADALYRKWALGLRTE